MDGISVIALVSSKCIFQNFIYFSILGMWNIKSLAKSKFMIHMSLP